MATASYFTSKGAQLFASAAQTNTLNGTSATETLIGTKGNDYVSGGGGGDTLKGGLGDDIYIVYSLNDKIIENAGEGIDTVKEYLAYYKLPENVENLIAGAWGEGNSLNNIITGGDGAQTLDGGAGDDVLIGGAGSDLFIVKQGNGSDTIMDFVTGSKGDAVRVDNYGFTSFAQIKSALTQKGADVVLQLSASETLTFKNQTVGSFTADNFKLPVNMTGLKLTFSDEFNNVSLYNAATGTGTWNTTFGGNSLNKRTLATNGEKQIYMDADFKGTSSKALGVNPFSVDNGVLSIHAQNATAEVSKHIGGYEYTSGLLTTKGTFTQQYGYFELRADLPTGKGMWPAFWLISPDGSTTEIDIMESLGDDTTSYESYHSTVNGVKTNSTIQTHIDPLSDGFHTFGLSWTADFLIWYIDGKEARRVATPDDMHKPMYMLVNLAVGGAWAGDPDAGSVVNADFKLDYVRVYAYDSANPTVLKPVETTSSATTPAASAPAASAPAETNSGRVVNGTAGDDIFTVGAATDKFVEAANGGNDTVRSAISFTLHDNIETLSLTGTANIEGRGNALANRIVGNDGANKLYGGDGNDTLDGGKGADTLVGGKGDDTYAIDSTGDVIVENANEGTDTVISTVSYALAANLENLTLTGTAATNGTGNELNNRILGNAANNKLSGGAGDDILQGGAGNDVLSGGKGADMMVGGAGADTFTFARGDGKDTITDFSWKDGDRIDISALKGVSYSLTQSGSNLVIDFGQGDSITLLGVSKTDASLVSHLFL